MSTRTDTGAPPMPSRRRFVGGLGLGIVGAAAGLGPMRAALAACTVTPAQMTGPFYPVAIGAQDWDLTRLPGATERAAGTVIEIVGRVLDEHCNPVRDAVIEVWQANAHGRYDHPLDPNPAPLDPNFQGYARLSVDSEGGYRILTVKPGAYPVNAARFPDWVRPPHIHFKVHQTFAPTATTQMYFAGDPLNDPDLLLRSVPEALRPGLIVDFGPTREDGVPRGNFDIVIAGTGMPGRS